MEFLYFVEQAMTVYSPSKFGGCFNRRIVVWSRCKDGFLEKRQEGQEANVHNNCLGYIPYQKTAKSMWKNLEAVFAKKSVVNQILLRKQLGKLRMIEGDSVAAHLPSFESLVRKLRISVAKLEEADVF